MIKKYSYNWPYDFCSLVELGKMNFKATFEQTESLGYVKYPPLTQEELDQLDHET